MKIHRLNMKDNSGATALEFALISPALILLIVGGFQLAWTLHCAASVRWALEKNARALMIDPTESASTLRTAMLASLSGRASVNDLAVTITPDNTYPTTPLLVATSTYRTNLSVPFLSSMPLTFTSTTKVPST